MRRILYVGAGLVIAVILILAFIVIPSVIKDTSPQAVPKTAVLGIVFVIIIHLLIVAALIRTILRNKQGGRIKKGLLIGSGIVLVLMSLMILDGASGYSDHTDPIMNRVSVSMYVCTGFNFIASVLVLLSAFFIRRIHQPS
ncbi:MAG: hypothetical protein R6W31_20240 [Bacteroidales bacterium]